MKILPYLIIFLLSTTSIFAQEETKPEVKSKKIKELGINATGFLSSYLSFNSGLIDPGAYILTYKSLKENGKGFRLGFGVFLDTANDDENFINLRIGYEKQNKINERWTYYWGFDFVANLSDFEGNELQDNTGIGVGPVFGLQHHFSDKIGLSTESSFYFLTKGNDEFTFKTTLPSSVIFTIRF